MAHSPRFERLVDEAKQNVAECSIEEVNARLQRGDAFHLVDVREESEFAADRLPSALHLGRGVLERDIEEAIPALDADIVLYCGGGFRSALAAESLQKMGYTNVKSMAGGIRAWRDAAFPLER